MPPKTRQPSLEMVELDAGSLPQLVSAARDLLLEYGRFVIRHPAAAQFCFGSLETEASGLPLSYLDHLCPFRVI